ncbi:hypothethical protein (plasmid) [Ralstonia solanacearum CMR15]|nr:hypothethical protein [Ralstonia solanacearum CMR15]
MQVTGCVIGMKKALKVSVWIGAFADLDDLLQYVDTRYADDDNVSNDFWRDIGLDWFDDDFREAALIEVGDLREEISAFSYGPSFADDIARDVEASRKDGENGMIMLFDLEYSVRERGEGSGRVRFLGSYGYRR